MNWDWGTFGIDEIETKNTEDNNKMQQQIQIEDIKEEGEGDDDDEHGDAKIISMKDPSPDIQGKLPIDLAFLL